MMLSTMCGDTQIEAGNLRKRMRDMRKKNESGRTGFDWQFSVRKKLETQCSGTLSWHKKVS